jgi:hypothetical protein
MQLNELRWSFYRGEYGVTSLCDMNWSDFFSAFNKEKLIRLAYFYLRKFSMVDLKLFSDQLDTYIIDLCNDDRLFGIENIY